MLKTCRWGIVAAFLCLFLFPARAHANCFVDCMNASGCWSARSDENVAYCSGTEARCETECRSANGSGRSYGAIAYSAKDEGYGYSDSWEDQKQAEKSAMGFCKQHGSKCKIMVWFYNSCGAVAADGKKTGWGRGDSQNTARAQALERCKKDGGKNCQIKASHCSG